MVNDSDMTNHFQPIEIMIEKINYLYSQMNKEGDGNNHIELSLLKKYSSELYDAVIDLEMVVTGKLEKADESQNFESQLAKAMEQESGVDHAEPLPEESNTVEDVVRLEFAAEGKRIMRRLKRINKLNGEVIEFYQDDAIEEGTMAEYKKPINKYLDSIALAAGAVSYVSAEQTAPEEVLEELTTEVQPETVAEETVAEQEVVAEEAVLEEIVAEEAVLEEIVAEEAVLEEIVAEEAVLEEIVAEETVLEEVVAEELSVEEEIVAETETPVAEVPEEELIEAAKEEEPIKVEEIEIVESIAATELPAEELTETIEVVEASDEALSEEITEPTIAEASAPIEASSEIESVKDSEWVKAAEEEGKITQDETVNEVVEEPTAEDNTETPEAEKSESENLTVLEEIFGKAFFAGGAVAAGTASVLGNSDTEILDQTDVSQEAVVDDVEQALESAIEAEVSTPTEILEINQDLVQEPIDVLDEAATETIVENIEDFDPEKAQADTATEVLTEPVIEEVAPAETETILDEAKVEAPVMAEAEQAATESAQLIEAESPAEEIIQSTDSNNFFAINNNQKIRFISELFGGEQDTYNNTLNEMSQCKNVIEAYTYINLHVKAKYKWNSDNETVREFQKIVKDKFLG